MLFTLFSSSLACAYISRRSDSRIEYFYEKVRSGISANCDRYAIISRGYVSDEAICFRRAIHKLALKINTFYIVECFYNLLVQFSYYKNAYKRFRNYKKGPTERHSNIQTYLYIRSK